MNTQENNVSRTARSVGRKVGRSTFYNIIRPTKKGEKYEQEQVGRRKSGYDGGKVTEKTPYRSLAAICHAGNSRYTYRYLQVHTHVRHTDCV